MTNKTLLRALWCSCAVIAVASPAALMAQVVPTDVPGAAEPGRVQQRLQIEARPEVGGEPLIEFGDEAGRAGALKDGTQFDLKGIEVEGASAFSEEVLREVYAPYVGKKASLATLREIAAKITALYRNEGYILSRAIVPPQKIDGGVATIRVIEGRVDDVRIEGEVKDRRGLIASMVEKIKASKPLLASDLERYLLLIEDLPGVSARAVLQPSAGVSGASDVIIRLSQKSVDGALTADNRGSRYLGPYQGGLTVAGNNLLGLYERTQLRGIVTSETDELRYGEIVHEEQIGSEGTKLAFSASYTATEPGSKIENLDIEGNSQAYSLALSHPFLRSRRDNLFGTLEFGVRNSDASALSTRLYEDRVRVLRAGVAYDFVDSYASVNKVDFTVTRGLDVFDTDGDLGIRSRSGAHPTFTKVNAEYTCLQPISGPWSAYGALSGQWSAERLLASEEFGLGGSAYGSAYDPSEITGDHGVGGRLELQYNAAPGYAVLQNYQWYGFYDLGKIWNRGATVGEEETATLSSAGLGLRFNATNALSGGLELAVPLTREVEANGQDGDHPRIFFNVAYRF